jgi:putative addiction module antidote
MNVKIRKIGNSEGIIIPKELLETLGLTAGDEVNVVLRDGSLRILPQEADLNRQLEAAKEAMDKYRVALRELAK